jgi:hypothetical protein
VDPVLERVLAQRYAVGAEGVRLHHVAPGLQERRVDLADHVRPRDDEVVVAPLQRVAAEVVRRQVVALDGGAHRPVEDEDALGQGRQVR